MNILSCSSSDSDESNNSGYSDIFFDCESKEICSWKEFYTIMKTNRNELLDFLIKNGNYNNLINIISNIEKHKQKFSYIFNSMMLGEYGLEANKQKAIYELPTLELHQIH